MAVVAAHLFVTLTGTLILFQIGLMAGLPFGDWTQGGRETGVLSTRGRAVAALTILPLMVMIIAILSNAGLALASWPRWTGWVAIWFASIIAVTHWLSPSDIERQTFGPYATILVALGLVVMTA